MNALSPKTPSQPEIETCLVLSTKHIPLHVNEWLTRLCETERGESAEVLDFGYGWLFVYITEGGGMVEDLAAPAELSVVLRYAQTWNCKMLKLDRDGGTVDDLPTWEW